VAGLLAGVGAELAVFRQNGYLDHDFTLGIVKFE
jgi:hypothetical protein